MIDRENIRVRGANPENNIEVDDQTNNLLVRQGVGLRDVVEADRVVHLKKLANMSQGALAIDLTDEIHPDYARWTKAIADTLSMPFFSMDVLTIDHRALPGDHAMVLEINAESAWLHHTFSERKQHDFPRIFLKRLFGME